MSDPRAGEHVPGRCAEHGGLMWSNAMRACITPDDVIRGGCRWRPSDPEAMGMIPVQLDRDCEPYYDGARLPSSVVDDLWTVLND